MGLSDVSAFSAGTWSGELGEFVSDDHSRLQEMLNGYDEGRYALLYIPARNRTTQEQRRNPWAIQETNSQTHEKYIIQYLTDEDMKNPAKILAGIAAGDLLRHSPADVINMMELEEAAERSLRAMKSEDARREKLEMASFLARGGKDKKDRIQLGRGRYFNRNSDGH